MSTRRTARADRSIRRIVIWIAWAASVILSCAVLSTGRINIGDAGSAAIGLSYGTIGAVIALRARENPVVGVVFLGIGVSLAINAAGFGFSPLFREHGHPLAADIAAWCGTWSWLPGFYLMIPVLLVVFPDGRVPDRRAWRVIRWAGAGAVASFIGTLFNPGNLPEMQGYTNPFGIEPALLLLDVALVTGVVLWMPIAAIGGPWVLIARFRRSVGVERQQLKWFVYAGLGTVFTYVVGSSLYSLGLTVAGVVAIAGVPLLPAAAAIAILRYGLYDIDVIINRTLVYGALTAILAAAYAGLVVTFQRALSPLTEQSDVAVAASTLAVAGLFGPVRRRVQSFIDRRFYRSRYDAQQTLENFSARLRDEIELEHLTSELVGVVAATMRPRHASLWLREVTR